MSKKRRTPLSERLTRLVDAKWGTRSAAAREMGISAANLSRYLNGEKIPSMKTLLRFAHHLQMSLADLEGIGPKVSDRGAFSVPNLGWVPAGKLADAAETADTTRFHEIFDGDGLFTLEVRGDSMVEAGIYDRDLIVVRSADHADPGDIVVADVNGQKTVKQLNMVGGRLTLIAFSPDYEPITLTERDDVSICGVVIGGLWQRDRRRLPPASPAKKGKPARG